MIKLGVNIDHVATLRQQRKGLYPDVLAAALACERAGADGITVHLREDRRHIQDNDVVLLRKNIATRLNLEMAVSEEIIAIALKIRPDYVCLVPEKRQELTTEGGLDVAGSFDKIKDAVTRLKNGGIKVSLFIDPEKMQVDAAKDAGADIVELHTGKYADHHTDASEFERVRVAGARAVAQNLVLNAGHGLDYENVRLIAALPGMHELNIGFSIVSRALFVGLEQAVNEMKQLL
jgi:pyridoxine 5-phosphate synthase